jgi:26S proteasome regulatory subunit N5
MRVLLRKEDYIRTLIVSNKINRKHLNDEGLEKLKLEFYKLMIDYYLHEAQYLDAAKCYKVLYDFLKDINEKLNKHEGVKDTTLANYHQILRVESIDNLFQNYVMFLAICPPELETKNMFNELRLNYRKDLDHHLDMKYLVDTRLSDDIIKINGDFLTKFAGYHIFTINQGNHKGNEHYRLFRKYLIQHNLNIYQKHFSQAKMEKISYMVGIELAEVESELADMVINGYIWARINRINKTVNFKPKSDYSDRLNEINYDLTKMLEKVENTCHLVHKENLKHDIK